MIPQEHSREPDGLPALPNIDDLDALPPLAEIPNLPDDGGDAEDGLTPAESREALHTTVDRFKSHADNDELLDEVVGKSIAERAVLVKVRMSTFTTYKKDKEESAAYGAGNVNKHLFRDSDRVKKAEKLFREAREYISGATLPWDDGVRVVPAHKLMEVMAKFAEHRDKAVIAAQDVIDHWEEEVANDMKRMETIAATNGKHHLANIDDYPDVHTVSKRVGIKIITQPIPTPDDFRVEVSDMDREALKDTVRNAERSAAQHVIKQLAEPVNAALERLRNPISGDHAVFRNTLVSNIADAAERMGDANISVDPAVGAAINSVKEFADILSSSMDELRKNQDFRDVAVQNLTDLSEAMERTAQEI